MKIFINGSPEEIGNAANVSALLKQKALDGKKGIIVLLNGNIIEKEKYEQTPIKENDKVELFSFVQGG